MPLSPPPTVSSLLIELLHLPVDTREELIEKKCLLTKEQLNFWVPQGNGTETLPKKNALWSVLANTWPSHMDFAKFNRCRFYSRFQVQNSNSIFTTMSYTKSSKRINYCVLLKDGCFLAINATVLIDAISNGERSFIMDKKMGVLSKYRYVPQKIGTIEFSPFPGHTVKLVDVDSSLTAYDPKEIVSKCVVALNNSLTDTYVLTTLVNHFETD